MTTVFPVLLVMAISWLIVQTGAIMYELTGLQKSVAHFQALSAFSGTGFTTSEAENVINDPVRRKITKSLMVLGNAGMAAVLATVIRSVEVDSFKDTALNFAVMILVFASVWMMLARHGRVLWLSDWIRRELTKRMNTDEVPHEDLFSNQRGFGVTRIEVPRGSRVIGKRLRDLNLRSFRLQVLAVEEKEGKEALPVPHPDTVLGFRQHLLIYGYIPAVQEAFAPTVEDVTESGL